jgi:hypothetical protein
MKITITQKGKILAHHTTNTPLSHYGQLVWIIENENPEPGQATFEEAESGTQFEMDILGVIGGWLVVRQRAQKDIPPLLAGIIWSDGSYYGNLIVTREGGNCVEDATLEILNSGEYMVRGTIAMEPFVNSSLLGVLWNT